ncbi:MAG: hypothetical protein KME14_13805 [Tildeniella torsiva UHER 1998/13D]|nr:hypothetical protein [Tildeniella torsiva UHER 1998/13D]
MKTVWPGSLGQPIWAIHHNNPSDLNLHSDLCQWCNRAAGGWALPAEPALQPNPTT